MLTKCRQSKLILAEREQFLVKPKKKCPLVRAFFYLKAQNFVLSLEWLDSSLAKGTDNGTNGVDIGKSYRWCGREARHRLVVQEYLIVAMVILLRIDTRRG